MLFHSIEIIFILGGNVASQVFVPLCFYAYKFCHKPHCQLVYLPSSEYFKYIIYFEPSGTIFNIATEVF